MKHLTCLFLFIPFVLFGQRDLSNANITVTEVAPGLYRFFVESVAVVVFTGDDGVLLVDAAYEQSAKRLKEEVEKISYAPIRFLINTHIHGDHTGGNLVLGQGVDIIAHYSVKDYLSKEQTRGDRVLPAFPEFARPNITFTDGMTLDINDEEIQLIHLEGGHTTGDVIVYFPKSKALAIGDLLFADNFPFVDTGNGGHPQRYIDNIQWVLDNLPNDIIVVGGHGPIYNSNQLKEYRATLIKTMEAVKKAKKDGLSLQEMKDKRILKEWESMGAFFITEDRWIETLYPFM